MKRIKELSITLLFIIFLITYASAQSWQKLSTEAYRGKQDDICFVSEKIGWYVNGHGKLYKTVDGGESWKLQLEKKGSFFRALAFVDSLHGYLGTVGTDYFPNVTDTIPLYRTTDGGKSWQPVVYKGPYVKGICAIDIVKEQYINHGVIGYRHHIYAVGRVGSPAMAIISHNNGETFTSQAFSGNAKMAFDIKMFDQREGFVCSASSEDISQSNALILHTIDGGKTWQEVYRSARPFETTWKITFPSRNVGYASIQSYNPDPTVKQQRIAKTTDGGKTWVELNLVENAQAREFGIGFIDENHGYVGTMSSGYETKDGGATWTAVDMGMACNKIRFYKEGTQLYGYAIGVSVLKFVK
ncbi:MAG: hypothetical protein EBU52_05940 [Cytophagia bacterium]|nr:hypothetical protein [Cytophagia bacterium]